VNVLIDPKYEERLLNLMKRCGLTTTKELLNTSITLLEHVVGELESGASIASVNEAKDSWTEIKVPNLRIPGHEPGPPLRARPVLSVIKGGLKEEK
jgi:hypothetical protein